MEIIKESIVEKVNMILEKERQRRAKEEQKKIKPDHKCYNCAFRVKDTGDQVLCISPTCIKKVTEGSEKEQ